MRSFAVRFAALLSIEPGSQTQQVDGDGYMIQLLDLDLVHRAQANGRVHESTNEFEGNIAVATSRFVRTATRRTPDSYLKNYGDNTP
jgi:hypothetical protein